MNYLIVGLGNIGAEYANTRHNMGFIVLDAWAQASNILFKIERYGATATISFKGRRFHLLKPSTYMNLSGRAVRYWMNELKIPLENLLIITDDINLPFGTIRMRKNGSAGGHNGLIDITETLGTQEYTRIRIGIGSEFSRGGQVNYVLGELTEEEEEELPTICKKVIDGIKSFGTIGPDRTMNNLNIRPKKEDKEEPNDEKE